MGKRKSASSLCHLGSHSTWHVLGPLLPYVSPCTGTIWLHLSPSLTLERSRLCITHVFSEPNMGLSHDRSTHIFECVDQLIEVKTEIIIPINVEPNLGRHWLNTSRVSPFLVFRAVLWHRYHYFCCLTGGRDSHPCVSDSRVCLLNLEAGCLSEVVGQPFLGLWLLCIYGPTECGHCWLWQMTHKRAEHREVTAK